MVRRRPACLFLGIVALLISASLAHATPPVLVSAVSRLTHGKMGPFDVMLPLTGGSGIECRNINAGMQIVITFDQAVTGGSASITNGTATINGVPVFSGSTMTVNL